MITVSCPTCSKSYRASDEAAGRRIKCKECGEVVLVPTKSDEDQNWWAAAPQKPGEPSATTTSPAQSNSSPAKPLMESARKLLVGELQFFKPTPPAAKPPEPSPVAGEPEFFETTCSLAKSLAAISMFFGAIGAFVLGITGIWAFDRAGAGTGIACLCGAVMCVVSIIWASVFLGLVRVVVDIARSLRAIRNSPRS
jgi:DNA-directed RNA polymerase subunit RPC12/RpoP